MDALNKSMAISQEGIKILDDAMGAKRAPAKAAVTMPVVTVAERK